MALPVTRPSDIIAMKQVKMLIYGHTGVGKTTLVGTAKNPIIFDCESGAYRSIRSSDVIEIKTMEDANKYAADPDLAAYDTVVIDSFYGLVNLSIDYLKRTNPAVMQSDGTPQMKGWGYVAKSIISLINGLINSGKDVICVSHLTISSKKGTDLQFYSPEIQGGARKFVHKTFDFIGLLSQETNGRTLDFVGDPYKEYKNTHDALGVHVVPDVGQNPNFLAELIETAKQKVSAGTEKQQRAAQKQAELRKLIADATDAKGLDAALAAISAAETLPAFTIKVLKSDLVKRGIELSFEYKDSKWVKAKAKEGEAV